MPALRLALEDGGDDDVAYDGIRAWSQAVLGLSPEALLGSWEGVHAVAQMGLAAHVEVDGIAFAAKVRELVLWLVQNRSPTNDEFATANRLQTIALGYDLAFENATPAERAQVRDAMRTYLDFMPPRFNYYCQAYNPYCGNHGMTVGAAMGLACIALWEDVGDTGRDSLAQSLAFAEPIIDKCLIDILPEDGAYREGVLYAGWILRAAAPYFEARRRFDGLDHATNPRFARMIEWLCYELAPDGTGRTNNLNDSPWSTRPLALHGTILAWAQARWNDPLARYLHDHVVGVYGHDFGPFGDRVATALWSRPIAPVNPGLVLPSGKLFADRGLYYYRSAWKTTHIGDEVQFALSTGKFYGGHAQEDRGQFTLAAFGQRFAVDCGAVGSTGTPKESAAHNLVLVDGLGQHNAGNSIGTDGRVAASFLGPFADWVNTDNSDAYATYSEFNAVGYPFPASDWSWGHDGGNPLERAERHCVVVKGGPVPAWVLIADDVRKDAASHDWDWLLHTSQAHAVDVATEPATISSVPAVCDVFFAHPRASDLALSHAPFQHGGVDPPTRRIMARAIDTVEPRFAVALVPRRASDPQPAYDAVHLEGVTTLSLDWGDVEDLAVFNPDRTTARGAIETDAVVAVVRTAGGVPVGYLAAEATALTASGTDLAMLDAPASLALAGDVLHVSSAEVGFTAFGPMVASVVGPDGPLPFERTGDYVQRATPSDAQPATRLFWVDAPHPNPTAATTTARFALARAAHVRATVVDVRGRTVTTLADGVRAAATHVLRWDGSDARGARAAAGVYFLCVEIDGQRTSRKLVRAR